MVSAIVEAVDVRFLFLDDSLAVIDKPSGLAVHRGWAAHEPDYAVDRVSQQLGLRVHPVHRLDRATSGVLLFALHADSARHVGAQLEAHTVSKHYLALVRGRPPETMTIDHAIAREPGLEKKEARTDITRVASVTPSPLTRAYSLVHARPRSGRPHQIRRHLKHIACPIIGDINYGKGDQNRLWRSAFDLHRLALHAIALSFDHPRSGERLTLLASVPDDLAAPLIAAGFDPQLLVPDRYSET